MQEAIDKYQLQLNQLMINFDRWASQNPDKLVNCTSTTDLFYVQGTEYREYKQQIKLLRLKLRQLQDAQQSNQNMPRPIGYTH